MKLNDLGKQKLKLKNPWQRAKLVKIYSDLPQALKREQVVALDFKQIGL